jgi:hypothetical protein
MSTFCLVANFTSCVAKFLKVPIHHRLDALLLRVYTILWVLHSVAVDWCREEEGLQ